jgi:hypothetical protein
LMVLYAYAAMMPGEIDEEGQPLIDPRVTPTDMEIKNIIKNALPEAWNNDFIRSNQKITNISLSSLISYMDAVRQSHDGSSHAQKQKEKNKQKNNGNGKDKGNGNGGGNGGDHEKDSDGKKRKFQKHGSKKSFNHGSNKQGRSAQPEDHCPIHPHMDHKFKDCFVLLDAKKYRAANPKGSNTSTST